jgi:transposase InsO family protein
MRYAIIAAERGALPVRRACGVLRVSVSGYYAWLASRDQVTARAQADASTLEQIRAVFSESRGTYGSPRVTAALRQRGVMCNRKRVARLMQAAQLVARARGRRKALMTDSRHSLPIAPNQLQQAFAAQRPNQKWLADITYVATAEGWLYLALVLDVFSRKIVGWAMDNRCNGLLVEQALRMALTVRRPVAGQLLHHSDRGSQYASLRYQQLLAAHGIQVSMSRKGNPYDNALLESCIGTFKTECADQVFASRQLARTLIFEYLEGWYNRRRLHSALGYLSPEQFEHRFRLDNVLFHSTG